MKSWTVILIFVTIATLNAEGQKLYWGDPFTDLIERSDIDGSNRETVIGAGLTSVWGVAIDPSGGKVYWVDRGASTVNRSNDDGTGAEILVSGVGTPLGIALDLVNGKVYWTSNSQDKIQRANLDGSGVEDVVTGLSAPERVDVDASIGKVYWSDFPSPPIARANLDGSNVETIVATGKVLSIAIDATNGKLYYTEDNSNEIRRVNLDGTNVQTLFNSAGRPADIDVDPAGGKVYWSDVNLDTISRADLDGSNVETLISSGLVQPEALAVEKTAVPGPVAPVIDPVANAAIDDGLIYTITPTLSQGTVPITWSILSPGTPPGDMTIDPNTGEITWTANFADNPVNMTIQATGPGGSDTESWIITVVDISPPVPVGWRPLLFVMAAIGLISILRCSPRLSLAEPARKV